LADSNSENPVASTSTSPSKKNKVAEEAANDIARQRCFCGSPVCSGYLGGKPKDERVVLGTVKGKAKVKALTSVEEYTEKAAKDKKKPPVKLEWAKAKIVLGSETGRKVKDREEGADEEEGGRVKKKLKSALSGIVRSGSLRGAAAKAKKKLTGQR
jgi:hypothetical protein